MFGDSLNDKGMRKRCENKHGSGNCEKNGAIFYPKCKRVIITLDAASVGQRLRIVDHTT